MTPNFRSHLLLLFIPLLSTSAPTLEAATKKTVPLKNATSRSAKVKPSSKKPSAVKPAPAKNAKSGKLTPAAQRKLDYALCDATERGDLTKMRELIGRGANVNVRDTRNSMGGDMYDTPDGNLSLMMAIQRKSLEAVQLLLKHGARPDVLVASDTFEGLNDYLSFSSPTPLAPIDLAAKLNQPEILKALFKAGASVPKAKDGGTVMCYAAAYNSLEAARVLLDAGVPAKLRFDELTPLIYASLGGKVEMVKLLVSRGAELNVRGVRDETALVSAIDRGHLDIAMILIQAGASPVITDEEGRPPLIHLCKAEIVDLSGLDPANVDPSQREAYERAKQRSAEIVALKGPLVKELIKRGANPNQESPRFPLPLLLAIEKGDSDLAIALLESGANPEKTQRGLPSPLRMLCQSGRSGRLANFFQNSTDGTSPIDEEEKVLKDAQEQDAAVVRTLFAKGASLKHGDNRYALADAVEAGNLAVARVLLEQGADPNLSAPSVPSYVSLEMRLEMSPQQIAQYEQQMQAAEGLAFSEPRQAVKLFAPVLDKDSRQKGRSPLHMAAGSGELEMVKLLLTAGARATQRDALGHSALWQLIVSGRNSSLLPLEVSYAAISRNRIDSEKMAYDIASPLPAPQEEALLKRADEDDSQIAAELLRHGASLDEVNQRGVSLLDAAVMYASPAVVEELLKAGALGKQKDGGSALAEKVITHGRRQLRAEPNLTILQLVFRQIESFEKGFPKSKGPGKPARLDSYQQKQVEEFAHIRKEMFKQRDYFLNLYGERDARVIRALQKEGVAIDTRDKYGVTPLMRAVRSGQIEVVRALLEGGADANATDKGGMPVISQVIAYGERRQPLYEPQPTRPRIEIGFGESGPKTTVRPVQAPRSAKIPAGREAAIRQVFGREDAAIIRLLLQHGANPTRPDAKGRTATSLAKQLGHKEALAALSGK